ncbi:hypothetical protein SLEP1_g35744 [Rubroshorea leprosula]|uniref:Secreted protein n=1 Tax=Rubroshorea leprosula TaxID=152421 RepID=A0AAV5KPL1_9ROSI|nr:hypothetical protein SLEP1_g35744 [Rubroshorea leprosula]
MAVMVVNVMIMVATIVILVKVPICRIGKRRIRIRPAKSRPPSGKQLRSARHAPPRPQKKYLDPILRNIS